MGIVFGKPTKICPEPHSGPASPGSGVFRRDLVGAAFADQEWPVFSGYAQMKLRSERGAVIIHVAIALIALLGFTAVIVDYGAMWVARSQAQSAADAGALAGALTLLEDPRKPSSPHRQRSSSRELRTQSGRSDVQCTHRRVASAIRLSCERGGGNSCIRVDVMRGVPGRTAPHTGTRSPPLWRPCRHQQPGRSRDGDGAGRRRERRPGHQAHRGGGQVGRQTPGPERTRQDGISRTPSTPASIP